MLHNLRKTKTKQCSWTWFPKGPFTGMTWLQLSAAGHPNDLFKLTCWCSLYPWSILPVTISIDASSRPGRSCASRTFSQRSPWWHVSTLTMALCCREAQWHPSTRENCSLAQSSTELSTVIYSSSRARPAAVERIWFLGNSVSARPANNKTVPIKVNCSNGNVF